MKIKSDEIFSHVFLSEVCSFLLFFYLNLNIFLVKFLIFIDFYGFFLFKGTINSKKSSLIFYNGDRHQ